MSAILDLFEQFDKHTNPLHITKAYTVLSGRVKKGRVQLNNPVLQQLLQLLADKVQQQLPQFGQRELTNSIHACHILQQQQQLWLLMAAALTVGKAEGMLDDNQKQQIVALLRPRDVAGTAKDLWQAASQGQQLPHQQWRQMVSYILSQHDRIGPRTCAYVLYAAAKMRKFLTHQQLQQLLAELCRSRRAADAADIAGSLWGLAQMRADVPSAQLQQLLSALCACLDSGGQLVQGHQILTALWQLCSCSSKCRRACRQPRALAMISYC